MMNRIAILGAGESGIGAALLAKAKGYEVFVSEFALISEERKALLDAKGIAYEDGGHSAEKLLTFPEVIKSPGIPYAAPMVKQIMEKGISLIDELEFASRFSNGKVIAITGTNGKTTTTLLTYHLMKEAGMDVGLAGNVGDSWARQLVDGDRAWWVLEVSSFQIDGFKKLKPQVAVILNITPDHLDRYEYRLENYIHSKLNLVKNMDNQGHLIYFKEDQYIWRGLKELSVQANIHQISIAQKVENGAYFDGSQIHYSTGKGFQIIDTASLPLKGHHNMVNVMAAAQAVIAAGADEERAMKGLTTFKNAAHRMEKVAELNGVEFINDSKGTNVNATYYTLAAYQSKPIIWIAGGVDKGNDYNELAEVVKSSVKALICLGKDNEKLKFAFGQMVPQVMETQEMRQAVQMAQQIAQAGDVVLLSPACSSFDLFKNYMDRGEKFIEAVKEMETVK
ncbi:UDP-N-acetylmuramoyl-L-alanine--D-glutamate ligase [Litoribacter ruber]|uniref:UDP-N-acetylmuramoyl-L-alanine--D-glutamate ligase n=1 Tax=Litoribacter ruber TaxID=702568 RepID=UPI001BD9E1D3|nr:UDP-N-acetylmuramoyl-L-alanine--D-glutamate ligase [Litoribacter ruber]MBT0811456.1 UDP-N-acetylmuramoyl-L-alanine--D-glutamate ligase [Litoribacter ruber]